jgi:hypothetical protein
LPEHVLMLCVDEKSQIQALDRSQAVFPMGLARRSGVCPAWTTSLFAALDIATSAVIGQCYPAIGLRNSASSSMKSKRLCHAISMCI